MKPIIYLLIAIGCALLVAFWAWALASGVNPLGITLAILFTIFLCIVSSTILTKIIKDDGLLSIGEIAPTINTIAIASSIIGMCVLILEYMPAGRSGGHGSHIDRRYSQLFFAITAYLLIFPFLSSRKLR